MTILRILRSCCCLWVVALTLGNLVIPPVKARANTESASVVFTPPTIFEWLIANILVSASTSLAVPKGKIWIGNINGSCDGDAPFVPNPKCTANVVANALEGEANFTYALNIEGLVPPSYRFNASGQCSDGISTSIITVPDSPLEVTETLSPGPGKRPQSLNIDGSLVSPTICGLSFEIDFSGSGLRIAINIEDEVVTASLQATVVDETGEFSVEGKLNINSTDETFRANTRVQSSRPEDTRTVSILGHTFSQETGSAVFIGAVFVVGPAVPGVVAGSDDDDDE